MVHKMTPAQRNERQQEAANADAAIGIEASVTGGWKVGKKAFTNEQVLNGTFADAVKERRNQAAAATERTAG